MMFAYQTDEACRSNVDRDRGGVQSMSMVTNQPFADCKRAVECQLTYSVFCIASKPSSAKRRKVRLAYSVARTACKQAVECQKVEKSV